MVVGPLAKSEKMKFPGNPRHTNGPIFQHDVVEIVFFNA